MASALLGGRLIGRPLSVRGSLARSRMSFWRVVLGSFVVAIPVAIAQFALGAAFEATLGRQTDVSIVSTTLTAALVGAPVRLRAERHRPRRRRPVRGGSPVVPRLPGEEGRRGPGRGLRNCRDLARLRRPVGRSRYRRAHLRRPRPRHQLRTGWVGVDDARDHGRRLRPRDPHLHGLRHRGRAADRDVRRPDARHVRPRPRPAGRRSRPGRRSSPVGAGSVG